MTAKYDIFKRTSQKEFVWMEAAEDIVAAKKRMISLGSVTPGEYRLWDAVEQRFVDVFEKTAIVGAPSRLGFSSKP